MGACLSGLDILNTGKQILQEFTSKGFTDKIVTSYRHRADCDAINVTKVQEILTCLFMQSQRENNTNLLLSLALNIIFGILLIRPYYRRGTAIIETVTHIQENRQMLTLNANPVETPGMNGNSTTQDNHAQNRNSLASPSNSSDDTEPKLRSITDRTIY